MVSLLIRIVVSVLVIVFVSEFSQRSLRLGALLLTLPLVSILAFGAAWFRDHDLQSLSLMARETLVLVPLGLPFFCAARLPVLATASNTVAAVTLWASISTCM